MTNDTQNKTTTKGEMTILSTFMSLIQSSMFRRTKATLRPSSSSTPPSLQEQQEGGEFQELTLLDEEHLMNIEESEKWRTRDGYEASAGIVWSSQN